MWLGRGGHLTRRAGGGNGWIIARIHADGTKCGSLGDCGGGVDGAKLVRAEAESAKRQYVGTWRTIATNLAFSGCKSSINKVGPTSPSPTSSKTP